MGIPAVASPWHIVTVGEECREECCLLVDGTIERGGDEDFWGLWWFEELWKLAC